MKEGEKSIIAIIVCSVLLIILTAVSMIRESPTKKPKSNTINKNSTEYLTGYRDALIYAIGVRDSLKWVDKMNNIDMHGNISNLSVLCDSAGFSECKLDTTNHNQLRYHIFDSIDVDGDISGLKEVEYTQK